MQCELRKIWYSFSNGNFWYILLTAHPSDFNRPRGAARPRFPTPRPRGAPSRPVPA
ncbi:unnamed protein product, partial [Larinioides sclopetarius]